MKKLISKEVLDRAKEVIKYPDTIIPNYTAKLFAAEIVRLSLIKEKK